MTLPLFSLDSSIDDFIDSCLIDLFPLFLSHTHKQTHHTTQTDTHTTLHTYLLLAVVEMPDENIPFYREPLGRSQCIKEVPCTPDGYEVMSPISSSSHVSDDLNSRRSSSVESDTPSRQSISPPAHYDVPARTRSSGVVSSGADDF